MSTNNSEPAFRRVYASDGMNLRDFFAANALAGLHSEYLAMAGGRGNLSSGDYENMAQDAYKIADAMLDARQP